MFVLHCGFAWMRSPARKRSCRFSASRLGDRAGGSRRRRHALAPSTFGIFDAFPNEAGRQAHLSGHVAAALMAKASELLAKPPAIEKIDVLAAKLPG